jgi:hypothetical protein
MDIAAQVGQCLPDIANIALGGFEGAMALARRNGLSITDDLAPGQTLRYEASDVVDAGVAAYYADRRLQPATAPTAEDLSLLPGGIGSMAVGIDFTVG